MSEPLQITAVFPSVVAAVEVAGPLAYPVQIPAPSPPNLQTPGPVQITVVLPESPSQIIILPAGGGSAEGTPGPAGPAGPAGPPGADGAGFTWRGDWEGGTTYFARDLVRAVDGNVYLSSDTNYDSSPLESIGVWHLFVAKGLDGTIGANAATTVLTLAAYLALDAPTQMNGTWYVIPK